jgi:hypothetical protein
MYIAAKTATQTRGGILIRHFSNSPKFSFFDGQRDVDSVRWKGLDARNVASTFRNMRHLRKVGWLIR